jgi:hypothetical protein
VPFDLQRKLIDDYSKTSKEEFAWEIRNKKWES